MLPKPQRLTTKDISALAQGKSVFGTLISLRYVQAKETKFAVTAPKKAVPRAVDRNRIRRRVYAIIKDLKVNQNKSLFIMFTAKKECLTASRELISKDITALFNKALK